MHIKLDKEYKIKTTFGTIREIETTFGKSFFDILPTVMGMVSNDQLKMIFIGVKKANPDMDEKAFFDLCDEYLRLEHLVEVLEKFLFALQFPGQSIEEVQARFAKSDSVGKQKVKA